MYYCLMTSKTFQDWIYEIMRRRDISAADLSRRSKISEAALSRILRGERNAGIEILTKIADGLDIPRIEVFEKAGLLGNQAKDIDDVTKLAHRINMLPSSQRDVIIMLINAIISQGGVNDKIETGQDK
jgi:transcriptional regulator with XRE-family HTH domain